MKATYRITTKTQYEFVEIESDEGTMVIPDEEVQNAKEEYEKLSKTFKSEEGAPGFGIPAKEFNRIYDYCRLSGTMTIPAEDVPLCEEMDTDQKKEFGALQRSINRHK